VSKPKKIGICIYCDYTGEGLTNEHIYPYGLNNRELILYDASCLSCNEITSRFEGKVLQGAMSDLRTALQFKSRHGERPKTIKQKVIQDGKFIEVNIPFNKFMGLVGFPLYKKPGIVNGNYDVIVPEFRNDFDIQTLTIGHSNYDWYKNNGYDEFYVPKIYYRDKQMSFERMVMKIAYCFAVYHYGYDTLKHSVCKKIILGLDKRVGSYMGSGILELSTTQTNYSTIKLEAGYMQNGALLSSVKFFPSVEASPTYNVVIADRDKAVEV
jgi:hypothetical protein